MCGTRRGGREGSARRFMAVPGSCAGEATRVHVTDGPGTSAGFAALSTLLGGRFRHYLAALDTLSFAPCDRKHQRSSYRHVLALPRPWQPMVAAGPARHVPEWRLAAR